MSKFRLHDKNILILSPEGWGTMFLSKHHYAKTLAEKGNKVYFLNPPSPAVKGKAKVSVEPSAVHPNILFVEHHPSFSYLMRFHFPRVFHFLIRRHLKKILKALPAIDLVWSFDLLHLYPLNYFDKTSIRIFHPMDEPAQRSALQAAEGADFIFAVTPEILSKYTEWPARRYQINHGVASHFFSENGNVQKKDNTIRVGLSGNFLRQDLDRNTLLAIMREHTGLLFECWGTWQIKQSNIGGGGEEGTTQFIEALQALPNVIMHGPVPPEKLAVELQRMDAFLICYDVNKDQSKGTNYHKIMEYLATGKVIVANNITNFQQRPDLVQMVAERAHNDQLPALFTKVISELVVHNEPARIQNRIDFAKNNTYPKHLEEIETYLAQPEQKTAERILS